MLLDIFIGVPMLLFILLGVRDGVVRKLVAIAMLIVGLIVGQTYMRALGDYLMAHAGADESDAPMYGFLLIFLGIFIVQSLLYKIITKGYKIGGIADRVGGTLLGFIEGAIFVSCMLFILALAGFPDRETRRDTRFYKSVVNIAPQILDFTSTLNTDTFNKLKEIGTATSKEKTKNKK